MKRDENRRCFSRSASNSIKPSKNVVMHSKSIFAHLNLFVALHSGQQPCIYRENDNASDNDDGVVAKYCYIGPF